LNYIAIINTLIIKKVMNKLKIVLGVLIILIVAFIALVSKEDKNTDTIKIGMVYSLTGSAAAWTEFGKKAADMAVEEINADGGINGRKIELIYEDGQTNPTKTVSAFTKLVDVDGVDVVVGDVWSFITNPMIPLAGSKKVVLISPTVMDASVENQNEYFFTTSHTVESQRSAIEAFFEKNPEIKSVYSLCWNDAWGNANSGLMKKIAQEKGVNVLGEDCTADFSATYLNEATKVKAANPDAVLLTTAFAEIPVKKMRDLGITVPILTTPAVIDAVESRKVDKTLFENTYFTNWLPDQEFSDKFYKKYGQYPWVEAQNSYEAIRSIAKALEKDDIIVEGLRKVKYEGVDGKIDFTSGDQIRANQSVAKLYILQNDSFVEVR